MSELEDLLNVAERVCRVRPMARFQARGFLSLLQNALIYAFSSTQDMVARSTSRARFMPRVALAHVQRTAMSINRPTD